MKTCRNCAKPESALREGGLCYRCWYQLEYGHPMPEANRIGSGAAQLSLSNDWPIPKLPDSS